MSLFRLRYDTTRGNVNPAFARVCKIWVNGRKSMGNKRETRKDNYNYDSRYDSSRKKMKTKKIRL